VEGEPQKPPMGCWCAKIHLRSFARCSGRISGVLSSPLVEADVSARAADEGVKEVGVIMSIAVSMKYANATRFVSFER
jgi:hypothetical protein